MYTVEIQVRDEQGQVVGAPVALTKRPSQFTAMEYVLSVVDASAQVEYWCQPISPESELRLAVDLTELPVGFKYRLRLGSYESAPLVVMDDAL